MQPTRSRILACFLLLALALLAGCASQPAHRLGPRAPDDRLARIVLMPIDAEVAELSAGGMTEKRDDWTAQVVEHLNTLVPQRHDYHLAKPWPADRQAELQAEFEDLAALFRAVTINQLIHAHTPGAPPVAAAHGTLVYQLGSIAPLLDAQEADAAILLFVRDDYATAGRKGLVMLGVVAGIPVRGGVTLASAALVTRDGRMLWMNLHGASTGDLRTLDGAQSLVAQVFDGAIAPDAPVAP